MQHGVPVLLLRGRRGTDRQQGVRGKRFQSNQIEKGDTGWAWEYAESYLLLCIPLAGEPTLAGLDALPSGWWYCKSKYAKPGVEIRNAIQTEWIDTIDEEWAAFFAENHFLVGVSLDGPPELHNRNRTDVQGKDTFNRVMKSVRPLKKHNVAFNILCVITGQNARSVEKLYRFYP